MKTTFKRLRGNPPAYEVSIDGRVVGEVRQRQQSFYGSALISWIAYGPDGTRHERTYGRRSEAAEALS